MFFKRSKEKIKPVEKKDVEALFGFLVEQYNFIYSFQEHKNCFGGYWYVCTYSYYNENGCFTIQEVPQRGEWDYYYAEKYCEKNRDELCKKEIDIYSVEKDLWVEPLAASKKFREENPCGFRAYYIVTHLEKSP